MIELVDVVKTYKTQTDVVKALDHVSLKIEREEIFGIIGFSGAGKSTLIRTFNYLEVPDQGQVLVEGLDLGKISKQELRKMRQEIGMIFQQFNLLWSLNVYDNIAFPMKARGFSKKEIQQKVLELLELVDLKDKQKAYPSQLSGGQKQRVGIARALANNPKVILCDEATSALDPQTTNSILELLKKINRELKVTIIVISHEMSVIKTICDRVAVLDQGKIIEVGAVEEVFLRPEAMITKLFVHAHDQPEKQAELLLRLKESYPEGHLLKLTFPHQKSEEAIISQLILKHSLQLNILHGELSYTTAGIFGYLYVHCLGSEYKFIRNIFMEEGIEVSLI